jgi:hypothetical protein
VSRGLSTRRRARARADFAHTGRNMDDGMIGQSLSVEQGFGRN